MAKTDVSAKVGKGDDASAPVTVKYDFGETIDDAVEKFGEKVVLAHVHSSFTIALQGFIRGKMKKQIDEGKPVDVKALQADVDKWKPGMKVPGKSKAEKIKDDYNKMSAEERAALLRELQAAAKAG